MCGIAGLVGLRPVNQRTVQRMTDLLSHRGPDDQGYWSSENGNICLGHRRLSIIDISSAGHQPMVKGTSAITYNGELYNYLELRKKLKMKGYTFSTQTDTETILIGYEEWGEDIVHQLRGMFAFAIWDDKNRLVFIARDRLGIKPLYYFKNSENFLFSSEIKSIIPFLGTDLEVNEEALSHYLTLAATPAPMTMFSSIYKLEPGTALSIHLDGQVKKNHYWDPILKSRKSNNFDEKIIVKNLKSKIKESIRLRMMSDVPIGVFLSGGLDSSLNVALMSELIDHPVNTFSVFIKDDELSNEQSEARFVADYYKTNHHEIEITSDDIISFLPEMVKFQDEPLADPVCIPLHFVSKLARDNGVYVIQVGEGADEIFFGYSLYATMSNFYNRFYKTFMDMPDVVKKLGLGFGNIFLSKKKNKYVRWALENRELFIGGNSVFLDEEKVNILKNSTDYNTYNDIIKNYYMQGVKSMNIRI